MIPLIQREVAEKKQWISERDILDVVAIAESTPGPIAVNSATFVGCKVGGFWGAFFCDVRGGTSFLSDYFCRFFCAETV